MIHVTAAGSCEIRGLVSGNIFFLALSRHRICRVWFCSDTSLGSITSPQVCGKFALPRGVALLAMVLFAGRSEEDGTPFSYPRIRFSGQEAKGRSVIVLFLHPCLRWQPTPPGSAGSELTPSSPRKINGTVLVNVGTSVMVCSIFGCSQVGRGKLGSEHWLLCGRSVDVTRILSLNSLHTSDRSDRWNSIELLRGPFQATTTEEWNYPIVRSI